MGQSVKVSARASGPVAQVPVSPDDLAWQREILPGVSRTFALTIPELPDALCRPVTNAYLLCRIADTIEDEATLSHPQKREFGREFVAVVAGEAPAAGFARRLHPVLSERTLPAERELVRDSERAIRVLHGFPAVQREAIARCVRIMCAGMERFQLNASLAGLANQAEMDRYCYHVAGVVGEALTELFCDYSSKIAVHRAELEPLAISFGQGLQMTNILKDIWDDRRRGACWLPRDVFARHGFDFADLASSQFSPAFGQGLRELVGVAHGHLENALRWTLLIPRQEVGIRRFALWALGMAVLTLRKVDQNLDFRESNQVKIKRSSVKATILATNVSGKSDWLLRRLFRLASRGLPLERSVVLN